MTAPGRVPGLSFDCACFVIHCPRLAPRLDRFKVRRAEGRGAKNTASWVSEPSPLRKRSFVRCRQRPRADPSRSLALSFLPFPRRRLLLQRRGFPDTRWLRGWTQR